MLEKSSDLFEHGGADVLFAKDVRNIISIQIEIKNKKKFSYLKFKSNIFLPFLNNTLEMFLNIFVFSFNFIFYF